MAFVESVDESKLQAQKLEKHKKRDCDGCDEKLETEPGNGR